jgi:hypothetical protein
MSSRTEVDWWICPNLLQLFLEIHENLTHQVRFTPVSMRQMIKVAAMAVPKQIRKLVVHSPLTVYGQINAGSSKT